MKFFSTVSLLVLVPTVVFAQPQNLGQFYALLINLMTAFIPVLIGATVVVFLWGVVNYAAAGGDSRGRGEAVNYIIWGVIGLFVMVSVWGLVGILTGTFMSGMFTGVGGGPPIPAGAPANGGSPGLPPPAPGGIPNP